MKRVAVSFSWHMTWTLRQWHPRGIGEVAAADGVGVEAKSPCGGCGGDYEKGESATTTKIQGWRGAVAVEAAWVLGA